MPEILVLNGDLLNELIDVPEFIDVLEGCFRKYSTGKTLVPPRTVMTINDDWWGFMPGYIKDEGVAIKIVSVIPSNVDRGLPTIPGVVILFDHETGLPLSILDGAVVTGIRTAAASMISVKYLKPNESGRVAFIGGGYQARYHLRFLKHIYGIEELVVYDVRKEAAESFSEYADEVVGIKARVVNGLSDALEYSDIIIEASTTESPVILGSHLKSEAHIVSIGAHTPRSRAIDNQAFIVSSLVVVDSRDATSRESGDIRNALEQGLVSMDDLVELGELSDKVGSSRPPGLTIYKSVGLAIEDVCAARYLYTKALEKGVGIKIEL